MQIEKNKYQDFLMQVKTRIQTSQVRAILSVNAELIYLYWDIGRMIDRKQKEEGWGAAVIPNLSKDIRNELPEVKGFSERNIGRMIAFFREYPCLDQFLPQPVAKLELLLKLLKQGRRFNHRELYELYSMVTQESKRLTSFSDWAVFIQKALKDWCQRAITL